jgi:hypothetical protein
VAGSLGAETAAQPTADMGGHVPEAGELDTAVRPRQVEGGRLPVVLGTDFPSDHPRLEGLSARQVADIHEAVDEAVIDAIFRRRRFTWEIRLAQIRDHPRGEGFARGDMIAGAVRTACGCR